MARGRLVVIPEFFTYSQIRVLIHIVTYSVALYAYERITHVYCNDTHSNFKLFKKARQICIEYFR